jgi:hypothetical protein
MKNNSSSRELLALVLTICVFLPAMAGMWWRYYFEFSAPQPLTLSGTLHTDHVAAGGIDRSFSLYVPPQLAANAPLVMALHGSNASGQKLRAYTGYEFDALADRYGFIVAYPDSSASGWNDCRVAVNNAARRQGINDVDFLQAVIANLTWKRRTHSPLPLRSPRICRPRVIRTARLPARLYPLRFSTVPRIESTRSTTETFTASGPRAWGTSSPPRRPHAILRRWPEMQISLASSGFPAMTIILLAGPSAAPGRAPGLTSSS